MWTSQTDAAVEDCLGEENIGGADSALVVTLPAPAELAKIEVQPGLPEGDGRAGQYHPTRLELQYDDGTCDQLDLEAAAGVQEHRLDGGDDDGPGGHPRRRAAGRRGAVGAQDRPGRAAPLPGEVIRAAG